MPRAPETNVIVLSSSSSSYGEDDERGPRTAAGDDAGSACRFAGDADDVVSSRADGPGMGKERKKTRMKKGEDTDLEAKRGESGSTTKKKRKRDEDEEEEKKMSSSPMSCTGDFVATSDGASLSSASCSFPMSRVKRLISCGDGAGSNGSNLRTNLDSVFIINQAARLFLEEIAGEAYTHAMRERKKSVYYKHLSSTVGHEKRYEFLSDFVPEKVRAEIALEALAEED